MAPEPDTKASASTLFTREDVAKHGTYEDAWVIIDDGVYDVSRFVARHPGGKVLLYYRGQDATEPFNAFHCDMPKANKFLAPLRVGTVAPADMKLDPRVEGFRKLRDEVRYALNVPLSLSTKHTLQHTHTRHAGMCAPHACVHHVAGLHC